MKRKIKKILLLLSMLTLMNLSLETTCSAQDVPSNEQVTRDIQNNLILSDIKDYSIELPVKSIDIMDYGIYKGSGFVNVTVELENDSYYVKKVMDMEYTKASGSWEYCGVYLREEYAYALREPDRLITDNEIAKYYFDDYTFKDSWFDSESHTGYTTYTVSYNRDYFSYNGDVTLISNIIYQDYVYQWKHSLQYTDEQLCDMAERYAAMTGGSDLRLCARIDDDSNGIVTIHIFNNIEVRTITYDRYYINRITGTGENTFGEAIDLNLAGPSDISGNQNVNSHPEPAPSVHPRIANTVATSNQMKYDIQNYGTTSYRSLYYLWDNLLNEIWQELKGRLDSATMSALTDEEINWIYDLRAELSRYGIVYEDDSLENETQYKVAAEWCENRVFVLMNYY